MAALPPAALPPPFLTTQEVLVLCGIDDSTVINGLIQDMLSPPEGIGHLQDKMLTGSNHHVLDMPDTQLQMESSM